MANSEHDDGPGERAADPPHRAAGHARADGAGGVRRGRAQRAPGGERDGALPRAPGVQGRGELPDVQGGQRDRRAAGGRAERVHQPRPGGVPHHRARGERAAGDRPAERLRGAPAPGRGGARPRARRGDPGDQPRVRPAVDGRRVPDRPGGVRRSPARAHGARPGGEPAQLQPRGDRRVSRAPLGGRARRGVPGGQPRARARARRSCRSASRASRRCPSPSRTRRRRSSRRRRWWRSATPTSRTCG